MSSLLQEKQRVPFLFPTSSTCCQPLIHWCKITRNVRTQGQLVILHYLGIKQGHIQLASKVLIYWCEKKARLELLKRVCTGVQLG